MPEPRGESASNAVLVVTADPRPGEDETAAVVRCVDASLHAASGPGRYRRAWVLLLRDGRPAGSLDVALPLERLEVEHRLLSLPAGEPAARVVAALDLPSISVVVPSILQREDELERCLASLDALEHPALEVLLVDNRPRVPADDLLPGLLRRHPNVRAVREPRPGISAARNAGVAAARGDVVAFTDDDVRVDPWWLRRLGERFATHPEEVVVTGLVVPEELETDAQLDYEAHYGGFGGERSFAPAQLRPEPGRRGRVVQFDARGEEVRRFAVYGIGAFGAGANMAFRRRSLLEHGGFDLRLGTGTPARGGEDLAALVDALWSGGALGYEPTALVHHTHRRERTQLERQMHGNGVGFTAMLTSLVVHDRRHLLSLAELLPAAVLAMARQTAARLAAGAPGEAATEDRDEQRSTRRLVLLELQGMPSGPLAYWRSHRAAAALETR